jgi:hypothetical protein
MDGGLSPAFDQLPQVQARLRSKHYCCGPGGGHARERRRRERCPHQFAYGMMIATGTA